MHSVFYGTCPAYLACEPVRLEVVATPPSMLHVFPYTIARLAEPYCSTNDGPPLPAAALAADATSCLPQQTWHCRYEQRLESDVASVFDYGRIKSIEQYTIWVIFPTVERNELTPHSQANVVESAGARGLHARLCHYGSCPGAVLGKKYLGGGWPLIIWEATTAKRNYYRTNYINQ